MGIIKKLDVENPRNSYLKGERTTKSSDLLSYNQNLDDFIKKNQSSNCFPITCSC